MKTLDPYEVLNIPKKSSKSVVKAAYRKLAQKHHPDKSSSKNSLGNFIIIKEAYDFIMTGESNTGLFKKNEETIIEPTYTYTDSTSKNVEQIIQIPVSFSDMFNGTYVIIPGTNYKIFVRPGTQHDQIERRLCSLGIEKPIYFNVQFKLCDPFNFYKLQEIDGFIRVCCHLITSVSKILIGYNHQIKNLNPNINGMLNIVIPLNHGKYIRIPNQGIKLDEEGNRSDLYIIPIVNYVSIENESKEVVEALNKLTTNSLKKFNLEKQPYRYK